MNCERAMMELPDYLAGTWDPTGRVDMQVHLKYCTQCSELAALWTKLGSIPEEMPPPRMRARFLEMLALETAQPAKVRTWMWQAAAAAAIAVFGFAAGRYLPRDQANEISGLRREVQDMKGMFALSLLQQQSASDRLRGVSYAYQLDKVDSQIREALLETLNSDSSVDVRLAAVDALRRMARQPTVRQGFFDSLGRPQPPLVQISLIDAVVDLNDRKSVTVLRKLQTTSDVDELVKQRASWGLDQMRARGISWTE